jgi:NitT/TauT family transport system substrate-binding protein
MQMPQSRRDFLTTLSAAGAAGVLGSRGALADEGPPEVTTIRLSRGPGICGAPVLIADELLRAEGFTEVRRIPDLPFDAVARGELDFEFDTTPWIVSKVAAGEPITALAGLHSGCFELFAHEPIRTVRDLKGKKVGIQDFGSSPHLFLALIAAHIGLDPEGDIKWITSPTGDFIELFTAREVDAFLGLPPEPQKLRARNIGRPILNTATDKPWALYLCCAIYGNRHFVRANPVATKRYLRAVLKAAEFCAADPERAAQRLVEGGFTERYDYALQALTEIPYQLWREFDPTDSMRFYALRLHEARMIGASPNQIIAEGTDWRFVNELKHELKA